MGFLTCRIWDKIRDFPQFFIKIWDKYGTNRHNFDLVFIPYRPADYTDGQQK